MTTSRSRRSSVRAVIEALAHDPAVAAETHDALWAVLWNRRYDDVDEPIWNPEASYPGILTFVRALDAETSLAAVDSGEGLVVFRVGGERPPIGSRVRVVPAAPGGWRFGDAAPLGLGVDLRFDDRTPASDAAWITPLRDGVRRLRELLDLRREQLAARRAQLGALSEPPTLEEIWRQEVAAISDRVAVETEYTPEEHAALARARVKGARTADEEERRIVTARKRRFAERGNDEIARFRENRWPPIRDEASVELRKYAEYRSEVVRLEDALQRLRGLTARANNATAALDRVEQAGFRVQNLRLDTGRLDEADYADELLRTVELLHAAIPPRAQNSASTFSAYRAPTAGPSVIPPRP